MKDFILKEEFNYIQIAIKIPVTSCVYKNEENDYYVVLTTNNIFLHLEYNANLDSAGMKNKTKLNLSFLLNQK